MTPAPLIEAKALSLGHGAQPAVENVDLAIHRGEIVTIVGPNGSGKSTLLKGLIGALPALSGQVVRAPGLSIGYVPQSLNVDATLPLTVARFLNIPKRRSRAQITAALEKTGAAALSNHTLQALSGGQFQRVLLARALLDEPDILILDEPTTGLDQAGCAALYKEIEKLRQELGCAVLMVSHDLHVVMSASDRVICINGHICCQGTPAHVAADPAYKKLFGGDLEGTLALYRHCHDHHHHHAHADERIEDSASA